MYVRYIYLRIIMRYSNRIILINYRAWNNTENLQEILNRIMQRIMSIITSALEVIEKREKCHGIKYRSMKFVYKSQEHLKIPITQSITTLWRWVVMRCLELTVWTCKNICSTFTGGPDTIPNHVHSWQDSGITNQNFD